MPMEMTSSPNSMEVKQGICLSDKRILCFCMLLEFFSFGGCTVLRVCIGTIADLVGSKFLVDRTDDDIALQSFDNSDSGHWAYVGGLTALPAFPAFVWLLYSTIICCHLRASVRTHLARLHFFLSVVDGVLLLAIGWRAPECSGFNGLTDDRDCKLIANEWILDRADALNLWYLIGYTVVPLFYSFAVLLPSRILIAHPLIVSPTASFWS